MSERNIQGPTSEDIITALERTGFLLEQRAAQQLENAGFGVVINDAFPDPDERKSRETDIFGEFSYPVCDNLGVYGTVLIECKNYANPVIVIGRESGGDRPPVDTCFMIFDPFDLRFPKRGNMSMIHHLGLHRGVADGQTENFIGNQIVLMERKPYERQERWVAENTSLYNSVQYPLLKARQYDIERRRKILQDEPPWTLPGIDYCFPVLLVSGDVYTVAVHNDGKEPKVTKAKWAPIRRLFHLNENRTTLFTDVVSFEHFTEYIQKRILGTLAHARDTLNEHSKLFDPKWLAEKYGEPEDTEKFRKWLADFGPTRDW